MVLYTDGVTEAMSPAHEEFSDHRLLDFLNQQRGQAVAGLVGGIRNAVKEFAAGAEQSDDLTMLALGYGGI